MNHGTTVEDTFDPKWMRESFGIEFQPSHSVIRITKPDGEVCYVAAGERTWQTPDHELDQGAYVGDYCLWTTPELKNAFVFFDTYPVGFLGHFKCYLVIRTKVKKPHQLAISGRCCFRDMTRTTPSASAPMG